MLQNFHGHNGDVMALDLAPSEIGNTFVSGVSSQNEIKKPKKTKLKMLLFRYKVNLCIIVFDSFYSSNCTL